MSVIDFSIAFTQNGNYMVDLADRNFSLGREQRLNYIMNTYYGKAQIEQTKNVTKIEKKQNEKLILNQEKYIEKLNKLKEYQQKDPDTLSRWERFRMKRSIKNCESLMADQEKLLAKCWDHALNMLPPEIARDRAAQLMTFQMISNSSGCYLDPKPKTEAAISWINEHTLADAQERYDRVLKEDMNDRFPEAAGAETDREPENRQNLDARGQNMLSGMVPMGMPINGMDPTAYMDMNIMGMQMAMNQAMQIGWLHAEIMDIINQNWQMGMQLNYQLGMQPSIPLPLDNGDGTFVLPGIDGGVPLNQQDADQIMQMAAEQQFAAGQIPMWMPMDIPMANAAPAQPREAGLGEPIADPTAENGVHSNLSATSLGTGLEQYELPSEEFIETTDVTGKAKSPNDDLILQDAVDMEAEMATLDGRPKEAQIPDKKPFNFAEHNITIKPDSRAKTADPSANREKTKAAEKESAQRKTDEAQLKP